jgi:class 3 adenylate cyclase
LHNSPPIPSRATLPIAGRRAELTAFEQHLGDAATGQLRLVLLSGDAGIGKTRLLRELKALARLRGFDVFRGRGQEAIQLPYRALHGILQRLIENVAPGDDGPLMRLIGRESPDESDRSRIFFGVSNALLGALKKRPALIMLEDLQWFDRSSLALLTHLLFELADARDEGPTSALVVATHRSEIDDPDVRRTLARLRREDACETIVLDGLDEDEVAELLEGQGLGRASAQLVSTLHQASSGNPLLALELCDQLSQEGALEQQGGYWVAAIPPEELPLPADLGQAIEARLTRVSPGTQRLLATAALIGMRFDPEELDPLLDGDGSASEHLKTAMRERLVAPGATGYVFTHPLVRQCCASKLPRQQRELLHLRIAEHRLAIGDKGPEAQLATVEHLLRAGPAAPPELVYKRGSEAAKFARRLTAWSESARLAAAAAEARLLVHSTPRRDSARLFLEAAEDYEHAGDVGPCLACCERSAKLFEEAGDRPNAARATVRRERMLITHLVAFGEPFAAERLEALLADLDADELELRAEILETLATGFWVSGDGAKAGELAQAALDLARQVGHHGLIARALGVLALAQSHALDLEQALITVEESLEEAKHAGDVPFRYSRLARLSLVLFSLGQLSRTKKVAEEAVARAEEVDDLSEQTVAHACLAMVAAARGSLDEAKLHARASVRTARRSGYPWGAVNALPCLAFVHDLRGESEEAAAAIRTLVEPGRLFEAPGAQFDGMTRNVLSLLKQSGPPVPRGTATTKSTEHAVRSDGQLLARACFRVERAASTRDSESVRSTVGAMRIAFERGIRFVPGWPFFVPRLLAVAEGLIGEMEAAEGHFEDALEIAREEDATTELIRTHLDLAKMLTERADEFRPKAREQLVNAAGLLRAREMPKYTQLAYSLAATLDVQLDLPRDAATQRPRAIAPPPRLDLGLASLVICFTDLEGSTKLIDQLGDGRARELLRRHEEIARRCLAANAGSEIQHTGDGFMLAFHSARDATAFAISVQRALAEHNRKRATTPLRVRVGMNAGEPIAEPGRLFGAAVNAAARICSLAKPGEILVSDTVRQLSIGTELPFRERGWVELKGFELPFHVHDLDWKESTSIKP